MITFRYIAIIIGILVGINENVYSQEFSYRQRPNSKKELNYSNLEAIKAESFKDAKNLTDLLPSGFSTKGDVDYTNYLQEGINRYDNVIMPNFPILINDKGLRLRNNNRMLFQRNSSLILKPTGKSRYFLIMIDGVKNVSVYYPKLIGDRGNHLNDSGQWGMGIWIKNSSDVTVHSPYIIDCWGDGIYLGNEDGLSVNRNVKIIGGILDNNRRNGISIIAGQNIDIDNVFISNTHGQNPQSGIDIEPNTPNDIIQGVRLHNITTYNNLMNGIVISPGNLASGKKNEIDLEIVNHKDYYSYLGLSFIMTRKNIRQSHSNNIHGRIIVKNSTYNDNGLSSMMNYGGYKHNVKLILNNILNESSGKGQMKVDGTSFIESFNNGKQYRPKK